MTEAVEIEIRCAKAMDVNAIYNSINFYAERGKLLKRSKANIRKNIRNFFVATRGGVIVGCACLDIYSRKMAELRSLAVSEKESGKGVGKLLAATCIAKCRKHGVLELMAITSEEKFFRSIGFDYTLPGERKALFFNP